MKQKRNFMKIVMITLILIILSALFFFLETSLPNPYIKIANTIFFVIIVLIAALFISKFTNMYVNRTLKVKHGLEKTPRLVNRLITMVIFIIALVMFLYYFNVKVTPLLAALGIGALAIGLALQPTLTNFFAGMQILSDKPVRVGDYVELKGENVEGYVEDIGWRSTRIITLPNNLVIIPNSKLIESTILNDYLPVKEMAVLVQVGVDYSSNLEKVEKITIDTAKKIQKTVPGAVENFEPFIRYHTFADNNIEFTVILRVKEFVSKYLIKHEFIKALKKRYDKEGIEISWPIRKISNMDKK